ncbi:MAG: UPF0158 family protein [Bacillaceae bacterium]|nr:UPF0158 family protein [Bacillaceae bacterium]
MGKPIQLRLLVVELDFQMEGYSTFVNKEKGEIVSVTDRTLRIAEDVEIDMENYPEWEQDMIEEAIDIIENEENFVPIPSQFDIDEYEIMETFSLNIEPAKVRERLCRAIQGRGAFRRFKDLIIELGVADEWYKYKEERLKEIAAEWCKMKEIDYVDDLE